VASGLTLVFGIMGIINLAHGSFYMIGAYLAFVLASLTGNLCGDRAGHPAGAAVRGLPRMGAVLPPLQARPPGAGAAHLRPHPDLRGVRSLLVGDEVHGVDIPAVFSASIQLSDVLSYPVYRLVISAVCIVLAVALYFVIQRTRLGMMIRAGNHDRVMVEALGININMIYRVVFALGVALAALAGMLAAPISSVFPNMGSHVLIISFVIVVIGGIGSVWGALVAALVIGFADTFGKVLVPELSGWSSIWSWPRCCCGGPKASSRKVEAMKLDTSWSSSCWRCRLACVRSPAPTSTPNSSPRPW
jgi:branched-chain amino acid transport system permease protein